MHGYQDWLPLRRHWLRYALGILMIYSAFLLMALAHGWPPFRLALLPSPFGIALGSVLSFGGAVLLLTTPGRPGAPMSAALGATGSVLLSSLVIKWNTDLGVHYLQQLNARCGTERAMFMAPLDLPIPIALMLSGLAWWYARGCPETCSIARASTCAALVVWLTVRLIVPNL